MEEYYPESYFRAAARAGVAPDGMGIAAAARDYLRGRNQWGRSFIVGPAGFEAKSPHHPAYLEGRPSKLLEGAVVGGPVNPSGLSDFGLSAAGGRRKRFTAPASSMRTSATTS